MIDQIGGWSSSKVGERYGDRFTLLKREGLTIKIFPYPKIIPEYRF